MLGKVLDDVEDEMFVNYKCKQILMLELLLVTHTLPFLEVDLRNCLFLDALVDSLGVCFLLGKTIWQHMDRHIPCV